MMKNNPKFMQVYTLILAIIGVVATVVFIVCKVIWPTEKVYYLIFFILTLILAFTLPIVDHIMETTTIKNCPGRQIVLAFAIGSVVFWVCNHVISAVRGIPLDEFAGNSHGGALIEGGLSFSITWLFVYNYRRVRQAKRGSDDNCV